MKILPANKFLCKEKHVPSSLCDFCNASIESIEHLFWECSTVQPLWNELNTFLKSKSINIVITKTEAMLGITTNYNYSSTCNTLIMIMKYYIYYNKLNQIKPSFYLYYEYPKGIIKQEGNIALNKGKYETNNRKWEKILSTS